MNESIPKPKIICITPIKNESWILDRFLKCASLWADHIIIADQSSDDGSRDIAIRYPKVILIDNQSQSFNEPERQQLLIEEARKIPGQRILIALDADEILTANFNLSPEWNTVLNSPPGTVIRTQVANIRPDMCAYWAPPYNLPFGFIDDGSEHTGSKIHSTRIPYRINAPTIILKDIKILHYQYSDWDRMKSKHRWYQVWERLNNPKRSSIDIYRQYHHMDVISPNEIHFIPKDWFCGYINQNIDITSVNIKGIYWWDKDVLSQLAKHGIGKFKREAIWDVDWSSLNNIINSNHSDLYLCDPRNKFEKYIHRWIRRTQSDASKLKVRIIERILKFFGW